MTAQATPRRGLVIDTQVAQHSFNGTSQKGSEQGEGEAEVVLDMKDWLARSNPSSPIGSPGAGQIPTRPIDLSSYLTSTDPLTGPSAPSKRAEIGKSSLGGPTKLKKPRSAWNLRAAARETHEHGHSGSTPASNGWGGFVNRLRSRSSHNLKADAGRDAMKSVPPPLPGYKSSTVPIPGSSSSRETLVSRPETSQGIHMPSSHRMSLGEDLLPLHPNDRSRSGSAAPSAMTYTSGSSTSGWSSRFPTPAATPLPHTMTFNTEGGGEVEVDPFDLTSPTTDIYNFSELGFLRDPQARVHGSGQREHERTCGESGYGHGQGHGSTGRYSVFGFGAGHAEPPRSIGKRPSKPRMRSARSLRDLRAAAGGLFGLSDYGPAGGPLKRDPAQGGAREECKGDEEKVIQKRSSLSWLKGTLRRRDVHPSGSEEDFRGTIVERPSDESLAGSNSVGTVSASTSASTVPEQQVLRVPVQRNKTRPALTITLPSSQSLCGARPAIPLSLSDEHGDVLAGTQSAKTDVREEVVPDRPDDVKPLPGAGSFTDLYAELGISPPGESDDEGMPYSPRIERQIDAFSFGDILASLGGARPIEVATPDKTHSVVIGKGSAGTSAVSSGRETKRSSWRSSRHSIKPASAPPTANLPPLPPLPHLQAGEKVTDTGISPQEQPLSPRAVDLSSGKSSAVELGFEPFEHIRSWEETNPVVLGRPVSDGTDDTDPDQSADPDVSMDYGFLDTYHVDSGNDTVDFSDSAGHIISTTAASGSAPSGPAPQTSQSSSGNELAGGYSATQIIPRGRDSADQHRRGGPSRSRSSSRSPRRAPLRAGSLASRAGTDNESSGSETSDSDEAGDSSSDDDVPLAQRIPGALKAQRTLRRETRRAKRSSKSANMAATPRKERRRPRTDGRDNPNWQGEGGVPARALEQKLLALFEPKTTSPASNSDPFIPSQYRSTSIRAPRPPAPSHQNSSRQVTGPVTPAVTHSDLSRHASVTRSASRVYHQRSVENSPVLASTGFTSGTHTSSRSQTPAMPPIPRMYQALASGQQAGEAEASGKEWLASRSPSIRRANRLRSGSTSDHPPSSGTSSNIASRKPSLTVQPGDRLPSRKASANMPTSPLVDSHVPVPLAQAMAPRQRQASGDRMMAPVLAEQTVVSRQSVHLESMQGERRSVDLKPTTTAAEVLAQILGSTAGQGFMGDWILFEVFGEYYNMERPIRSFESLVTIMKGWNGDLRNNAFLAKRSPLDRLTRTEMMPRVQPMHGVYVQHETKRGKWSKRWIELRNGNVIIAKNDRGKENDFLCSSSAFDPYILHGNGYKGPKPFIVVLKSREPATLFESPGDYLHVFSLDSAPGIQLMEALFTAKSCAMLQAANTPAATYAPIAHPTPTIPERKPQQPLVDLKSSSVFTGGSLLSKLRR